MKRIASLFLAFTLIFSLSVPAAGADDATGTTLRLEETEGNVSVQTSAGTQKSIIKSMRLYNGYTVTTGASSSAFISLDDTKAVKLDASSKVSIKKSGKRLEISLSSGQIFFNVTRPLATDESFSIRTSTMVTGIRGSFGWVTPEKVGLMHGRVIVTSQIVATGSTQTVELTSGEQVTAQQMTATPGSEPTLVKEPITNEDVPAIVVEEVAKDETLQSQLEEDVPGIDVTELVESLPEKQAEEAAKEQEVQKQVEEAVTQQAETIAASEADTANGGDSGTDYYFADTSETSASQGSTDTTGSGNTGGTTYSPSVPSSVTRTVTVVTTGSNLVVYSPNLAGNKTTYSDKHSVTTFSVTSGDTLTICATHPQVDDTGEKAKWMFSEEPELHDSDYGWVYYRDSQQSGVYLFTLQVNADANLICAGYAHAALNSSDITDSSVLTHALEKFKYVRIQGNLDLAGPLNVEGDHELLLGYNTTLDNNTHTIDGTLKLRGAKLNLPSASSVLKVNGSIDSAYSSLSVGGTMDIKNMLTADANTSLQIDDTGVLNNYGFTRVYDVKNAGTIHNISGKFVLGSGGVIDNTNGIIKTESGAVFVKLGTIKGNAVDGSVTDTDPDELLTRLGVAEMIYKAATGDTTLSSAGSYAASAPADTAGLIDVERGVIGYCLNAGYVSTDESGNYNPNQTITRAQTASYLTSLAGNRMPPSDENYRLILAAIPDVSESAWYAQYVIRLYQAGIIGSGNFNPNAWITVAQAQRWIDAVQDLAKGEGTVTKTYTDGSKIGISGVDYDYVGPVKSDPQLNAAMTFYYRSSTKEVVYIKYSSGGAAFAFLPGYPMVIANSFDAGNGAYVQISVVSNKDCRLYYALYPEGGIEPTGQQFISGNLGQPVRSDKLNLLAKQGEIINLNGLKERTDYDLYLWLSDDNNDLSCAVQKLSFTTADGSAPAFRYGTPSVSDITSDSISLTVNVSEDATVYWVAVKAGTEYLKSDTSWSDAQWATNAVRQIESGTNSIAHGKASVQANTDAAIDIDGLDPATSYDIYFVAMDSSGNYSQLVKGSPDTYMLTAETQSAGSVQVVLRSISTTSIKDSSGADIPIDMAFSLIPVFTNTASSVCWDMILWADASCKLQIYELSDGLPSATGNLISSSSGGAADVSFVPAAGGDKIGHSLSRDYQGQASFPSVNGSLQNGQAKYYGIHITQLNGIDEGKNGSGRKKWDGTININVSVLTGTETELNGLPSSITETSLNAYKGGTSIAEIHSPNPFSMRSVFTNTTAPGFAAGYPLVTNVTDTTATIRVALDSAGTLYYVVAPVTVNATSGSTSYAPAILTTLDQNGAAVSITDKNISSIPESGDQPAFAQQPAPYAIYSPSFSNGAIQSGQLTMSTGYNDISLSTLQPDTLYFVYFVTKGQGQVYSEQVMLYQFKTKQ